jgi:asparagine synthase (glutamine-hydrolysing)
MCGLAGILSAEGHDPDPQDVQAMIDAIAGRGPDGTRIEARPGVSLAHARLSIIDLESGWQPLHAAGSTIVGNGEIYNYLELAQEFDLSPKTGSDFEPLLHLYAREGSRAFARLRGMYAFCLLGCDGRAWLVRDPFGIKPLYLSRRRKSLLFASEPHALWRVQGGCPGLSDTQVRDLLSLNYVLDEPPGGGPGLVERLAPGAIVEVVDGAPAERTRAPAIRLKAPVEEEAAALRTLDGVLEESVRIHQRSDVPYGLFLSGGIDSTAIAVMMARLNERPVTAFTCGFDVRSAHDERAAAERVARALNLDWRETVFTEEDFWRIAPRAALALDDPTSDYACLPTYKLAEAARGTLTVILSGEGGDELFGGYGRYRRARRPAWLGGRPAEPQIDDALLGPEAARTAGGESRPGAARGLILSRWRAAARRSQIEGRLSRLQRAQSADMATWLASDLLLKLDRCLMAHGLEGRTPFLDCAVAAFAFNLPDRLKVRGRFGKWLLRRWLASACPAADPWARKRGFTVPVAAWIAPRARDIGPRVACCPGVAAVCDRDQVERIFADDGHEQSRWPLLFYALWWSIHMDGLSAEEAGAAFFTGVR